VADLVTFAIEAERAGLDAVMVSEHVVLGPSADAAGLPENPRDYALPGNQDPATPWPSPLVLLSAVAAATTRIRLVAGALISPLRHPLASAKDLATLDRLSGGRLVVQPTVSWHRDEYDALGVPFGQRGEILDEQLEIWAKAWRGSPVNHDGKHYSFGPIWVEPLARAGAARGVRRDRDRDHRGRHLRLVLQGHQPDHLRALDRAGGAGDRLRLHLRHPGLQVCEQRAERPDEEHRVAVAAVLVTGGGTGIGAAVARLLRGAGNEVAILGRRPEALGLGVTEAYELVTSLVPARRPASAPEVAAVVAWLLSDASSYVNGAVIPVDGAAVAMDVGTLPFDPRVQVRPDEAP